MKVSKQIISEVNARPADWEVGLGNRVALDYLQVVDSLWFSEGGNEIDQKRKGAP